MKTIDTIQLANVKGAAGAPPTIPIVPNANARFDAAYKRWSSSTARDPGPAPYAPPNFF